MRANLKNVFCGKAIDEPIIIGTARLDLIELRIEYVHRAFRNRSGFEKSRKILSLGLLFIAVQLSDLIYGVTLLTGIEKVSIVEGANPLTSAQYTFFPYSHSLVATLVLAGLVALIFLIFPFRSSLPKSRTALVMATAVTSHFVLDVVSHNPDIDLLGNGAYKIGLGLWNYPIAHTSLKHCY